MCVAHLLLYHECHVSLEHAHGIHHGCHGIVIVVAVLLGVVFEMLAPVGRLFQSLRVVLLPHVPLEGGQKVRRSRSNSPGLVERRVRSCHGERRRHLVGLQELPHRVAEQSSRHHDDKER